MGRKRVEEKSPGVPAYIVTFSDMITLLLTFFVMLQSMAKVQVENHKFQTGCASLNKAFSDFGNSGKETNTYDGTDFEHPKPEYAVEEGKDEPENRSVDTNTEMLRRIMMDIEKLAKISPSPISGMYRTYMSTQIHFQSGQIDISEPAVQFLNQYCKQLQINMAGQEPIIYVLGIASAESDPRRQWTLSAKRAQKVADLIRKLQPADAKWTVYSWGAGAGGDWVGQKGIVNAETEIMIAVLTQKE